MVLGAGLAELLLIAAVGDDGVMLEHDKAPRCLGGGAQSSIDPAVRARPAGGRFVVRRAPVRKQREMGSGPRTGRSFWPPKEAMGRATRLVETTSSTMPSYLNLSDPSPSFRSGQTPLRDMVVAAETTMATGGRGAAARRSRNKRSLTDRRDHGRTGLPRRCSQDTLNVQVHGDIRFAWEHAARLHVRRQSCRRAARR